jgi:hypothetical protein
VDIEDPWFWRYWAQAKTYAKMASMNKGILIITFINGNYTYDSKEGEPTGMAWMDEWTDEELDETWEMIKAYATAEGSDD